MNNRERFEAWAKAPPREWNYYRNTNDQKHPWPSQYREYHVQCAWEAWQAAQQDSGERNETR